ncbi:MAG: hypothetical protein OEW35_13325, partial [Gammaproteobacteria bacterium]|nr:hypothetical protein [Gammaproteobacteria bacterium]
MSDKPGAVGGSVLAGSVQLFVSLTLSGTALAAIDGTGARVIDGTGGYVIDGTGARVIDGTGGYV